ncbi:MAG: PP2C family serine/threonine-protein phosphatase [Cyanobacteria bacterium P01_A01_bin.84]
MKISKQVINWRVVAASVCGTSHQKSKQLCQDAHHWQLLPDNILVAAVADGAGSASQGKVGAMIAVETAVENLSIKEFNRNSLMDDATVRSLLSEAVSSAKKAVEEEAYVSKREASDLSTTLIVIIATPELAAVAQVGDGVAVAKDIEGNLLALTIPDNGEYINETTFLTSPTALDTAQLKIWRQAIVNVGVITDGLEMLAMNMAVGAPHEPFFLPLFEFVANAEDKTVAKEQLVKFLRSDKITQRTDDDLTLIVGALSG